MVKPKARKRLTPEQLQASKRAYNQLLAAERKQVSEVMVDDLRSFENRFSSDTVALDPRSELRIGSRIGNGCRWLRSHTGS